MSDNYYENYESGPFCQHYHDPCDCEKMCSCGHSCSSHRRVEDQPRKCEVDGCECEAFKDDGDES